MNVLIGNTGLVGQTLCDSIKFDLTFNSKNIDTFSTYDLNGADLYLSCLPAAKWKINQDPFADIINATRIATILANNAYSRIVLISTIDVYTGCPIKVNEDFAPPVYSLHYGSNRYIFELLIKRLRSNTTEIFRLPALFSKRIKKNVLFDLLNNNNVDQININSKFQWYNLSRLVRDIGHYGGKSTTVNLFTEPVETADILSMFDYKFDFSKNRPRVEYDWCTKYESTGYIRDSSSVLAEIEEFIHAYKH